jgi:hypothetical protein
MRRRIRRPSPAMVVAIVALIAALGGTAVAAGVLSKKKVKNIAANQVTKLAPTLDVKSAKSAGKADNVLFARVAYSSASPSVTSSSGGVTGDGENITGTPRLIFPRDMTSCAITANVANSGGATNEAAMRQSNTSTGATVVLSMWRTDTGASLRSDFNVIAVCP